MDLSIAHMVSLLLPLVAVAMHAPKSEPANFTTADGVEIVGDYYPPDGRAMAPAVVLLHQYRADRTSWRPLIPKLHEAGFAVLAIDMRGFGSSTKPESKKLAKGVAERDPAVFNVMYEDVAAARDWLSKQPNVEIAKLGLVGASVGCSVSLHYANRNKSVTAVVCLSPGTDYMGVDSAGHIKAVGELPMLLLATEAERAAPTELARLNPSAEVRVVGPGEVHGTQMLTKFPEVGDQIAEFLGKHLRGSSGANP